MYAHALRKKDDLELTALEIFDTKTTIYANVLLIVIGFISIIVAMILPKNLAGISGFVYALIGPAASIFHSYRGRKKRKL